MAIIVSRFAFFYFWPLRISLRCTILALGRTREPVAFEMAHKAYSPSVSWHYRPTFRKNLKMTKINFLVLSLCFTFIGCKLPTVTYFSTQPFIKAYKIDIDKNLTIVIDQNIPDSLQIKSAGVKRMTVLQYRMTLEDALMSTFKSTYNQVDVGYTFSPKGISIVLVKATPAWNKKSSRTIVTGSNGNMSSSTKYELDLKIIYQAIIYSDGERIGTAEGIVFSEKSTFKPKETPEVFKDGVKVMCEEIYKQTIGYK